MRLKIPVNVGATVLGFPAAMTKINPYFRSPAPLRGCRKICHTVISTTLRGLPGQLCSGCEAHTAPLGFIRWVKGSNKHTCPTSTSFPLILSGFHACCPQTPSSRVTSDFSGSKPRTSQLSPSLVSATTFAPASTPLAKPLLLFLALCASPLLLLLLPPAAPSPRPQLQCHGSSPLQPVTLFDLGLGLQEADTRW